MSTRVVGDVAVRVGADVGPLKIGLQDAGRRVNRFGRDSQRSMQQLARNLRNVAAVGVAALGGLMAGSRQAVAQLDAIGKKAAQIGTTAESLQALRFAAESAGVSTSSLDSSVERFVKRLGEAEQGFGAAVRQLEHLGLAAEDLTAMGLDEALATVADRMAAIESPTERAAVAAGLFGREGVAMVNMLGQGADALRDTMRAAEDFGAIVSNETVAAAEDMQDRLGRLGDGIRGQLNEALVEAGPLLISAAEYTLHLARRFNGLVTFIADAYQAIDEFLSPLSRLESAHDEVTNAMADEIRQSQLLDAALEQGGRMSESAARVKLQEAQARFENARAAVAEAQAIARGSDAMQSINERIRDTQDALNAIAGPGADIEQVPMRLREQFGALEASLVVLRQQQSELNQVPLELEEQMARTEQNVNRLTEALAGAREGIVSLDGSAIIEPITPSDDESGGGGGGGGGGPVQAREGSALEAMLGIDPASMAATEERMTTALERQQLFYDQAREALIAARERGLVDQVEYNRLETQLQAEHNGEMQRLRMDQASQALGATSQMFEGLAQVAQSGGDKLLRISKVFGAAKAFVDTMSGAAEALKLPFPANLAAAAQVVSTGAGLVAAIKGASAGGSNAVAGGVTAAGGGSLTAGNGAAAQPKSAQDIVIDLVGANAQQVDQFQQFADTLNEAARQGLLTNITVKGA